MPKQPAKKKDEREVTRKEAHRRRRDVERTRRIMYGLIGLVALLVIIIAAGVIQELVIKPRQPVATVNGSSISLADYQKMVKYSWVQASLQGQQQDPTTVGQQTLSSMEDEQLIRQQAKQRGISVSQDEINTAIEQSFGYQRNTPTPTATPAESPTPTRTPAPTATPGAGTPTATVGPTVTPAPTATPITLESYQQQYKSYVDTMQKQTGMTEADFRNLVEVSLLQQKLFDQVTKDVPTKSDQVQARHILVSVITPPPTPSPAPTGQPTMTPTPQPTPGGPTPTPTPAPRNDQEALARAQEVKAKLDAGGDFAALAKQYSDDTGSAQQGGDLGWFGKGQMVPEFETAAFSLTAGQITDPVKTSFGYHIIQVLQKDPQHPIDPYTLQQDQSNAWTQWLGTVRADAKIENNWTADDLPTLPGATTAGTGG